MTSEEILDELAERYPLGKAGSSAERCTVATLLERLKLLADALADDEIVILAELCRDADKSKPLDMGCVACANSRRGIARYRSAIIERVKGGDK